MPFRLFAPLLAGAHSRERLIGCIGAVTCIALTMAICAQLFPASDIPAIVAPMGASAVLLFAVPSSPLAQPWPVVGGNMISALVGVAVFRLVPDIFVAAGVAVGGAILVMSLLRCLHPPGGAAALTAVIGGSSIHEAGYAFALVPVGLNSVALVLLAAAFHRMTGRSYPHRPALAPTAIAASLTATGFHTEDIDAGLADMDESFDISREDLDLLLARAELHAGRRRKG
jgi:CBS domain-containing membrane protein